MSTLIYGGTPNTGSVVVSSPGLPASAPIKPGQGAIELDNCQLLGHRKQIITEHANYKFTRYTIHVRAVLNPLLNSYTLNGQVGSAVAVQSFGQPAAVTEFAIRNALAQPRKVLIWSTGTAAAIPGALVLGGFPSTGVQNLVSPRRGCSTDANNGPFPLFPPIVRQTVGTKSFHVEFAVQTDINESYLYTATPPTILSHEWKMETNTGLGMDSYSTRVIKGRAVFDTSVLNLAGQAPDDFRAWLFHPVPAMFRRDQINVVASEDGTAVEYTIVDNEQSFAVLVFPGTQNPTRIESTHRIRYGRRSLDPLDIAMRVGTKARGAIATPWGAAEAAFAFGLEAAPRMMHVVTGKVWGNTFASRSLLYNRAQAIVADRLAGFMGLIGAGGVALNQTNEVSADNMGTYVEAWASFETGPALTLAAVAGANAVGWPTLPAADPMVGVTAFGATQVPPLPAGDNKSRGDFVGRMVANTIKDVATHYTSPAAPPNVTPASET
jgi:hypothetical protein